MCGGSTSGEAGQGRGQRWLQRDMMMSYHTPCHLPSVSGVLEWVPEKPQQVMKLPPILYFGSKCHWGGRNIAERIRVLSSSRHNPSASPGCLKEDQILFCPFKGAQRSYAVRRPW